ncbi:amidohydrolase family protein [Aminipila butyrica]|uniref:Amidohydrolase family protein n=1 Tax=Aminipila butyrica TaxID=433296 RepID=A0A858BRF4_9FIRM|nr:amidohydrolase family protein [Aminipila butyrica]QIB68463.1 amidohydrolase family protein [Aminipila butyrica]
MLDLLIRGGKYPDYRENKFVQADLGIRDGKVVQIGSITEPAQQEISAENRIVSPGFLDIHMHEENFQEEGDQFVIAEMMVKMGVTTCLGGNCGVQYQDLALFKDTIQRLGGAPVNYLMLAGYNAYRKKLGVNTYAKATGEQQEKLLEQMKAQLAEGAYGFSFGIEYDPGMDEEEIMHLLSHFEDKNLFVSAHYRSDATEAIAAIQEMVDIAERSQMKFQISHLSSCSATGQMTEALALINREIERNPKLNFDTYPYCAFSTEIGSAVFDEGCFETWGKSYDCVLITDGEYQNQYCDKEIFEKVRKEQPQMLVVAFVMNEEEIAEAIANPTGMIASDGIISHGKGHPRAAGTFPRLLGKYVRQEKVLSLLDALRKITLEPAKRLDLHGKGQIFLGCDADLTIFDPDTILDKADFSQLDLAPEGIDYVIVNGQIAVEHAQLKNGKSGRFISYNRAED